MLEPTKTKIGEIAAEIDQSQRDRSELKSFVDPS